MNKLMSPAGGFRWGGPPSTPGRRRAVRRRAVPRTGGSGAKKYGAQTGLHSRMAGPGRSDHDKS